MAKIYRGDKISIEKRKIEEPEYLIKFKEKIEEEIKKESQTNISNFTKKDTQYWINYNRAKCNEKRFFYLLLDELLNIIQEPPHNIGRKPISTKDMIFSSCLKVYNGFSSRKISSDLKHAEEMNYITKAPHFNTLMAFMNNQITEELLKKLITISAMPLKELETDFSMDATGFGSYQYERWMRVRFQKSLNGKSNTRGWRNYVKLHICCGTKTNVITSAQVTYGNIHDTTELPYLVTQTSNNFNPIRYSADKGYASKKNMQLIASLDSIPYIPFKINSKPEKKPSIWNYMYEYFKTNRERYNSFYHKRSNSETVFSMIKMRLGEFLKCKNHQAQKNEVLLKCLVHNICILVQYIFESNIKVDFNLCEQTYLAHK